MCFCNPSIRTPWCDSPECQWHRSIQGGFQPTGVQGQLPVAGPSIPPEGITIQTASCVGPVRPITPKEALANPILSQIPDWILDTVNDLLREGMVDRTPQDPTIRISQDTIMTRLTTKRPEVARHTIYENKWLDFEPHYEAAGWKVVYDKPPYWETGPAWFLFTPRGKG